MAEAALAAQDQDAFQLAVSLIGKDVAALPERSIAVREKWKEVKSIARPAVLQQFDANTKAVLLQHVAPLMQWVNISGHEEAHQFDRLVCQLQTERLKGSSRYEDLQAELVNEVSQLRINLTQVAVKTPDINKVKSADFWANATVQSLEEVREDLRGVMRYRLPPARLSSLPRVLDIKEDEALIERKRHIPKLEGLELVAYRNRVLKVLTDLFDANPTLKKIKAGQPVAEADLQALISLVLTQDPSLDLTDLMDYYPETAPHLDVAIRGIIGLDAGQVEARFLEFVEGHKLNSHQVRFLDLLKDHIRKYGSIEVTHLYEAAVHVPPQRRPGWRLRQRTGDRVAERDRQLRSAVLQRIPGVSRAVATANRGHEPGERGLLMITGQLKSRVDRLWDEFWTGGISNPLTVIEQITYLLFLRLLDIRETTAERQWARQHKSQPFPGLAFRPDLDPEKDQCHSVGEISANSAGSKCWTSSAKRCFLICAVGHRRRIPQGRPAPDPEGQPAGLRGRA